MKQVNNNLIVSSLGILAILAFGLISMPSDSYAAYGANAYYGTSDGSYYDPIYGTNQVSNPKPSLSSINPKSSNVGVGTKTVTMFGSGFIPSSIARINGSNRPTTFIDSSHLLIQITGNDTYTYRTNGGFFITVFNGAPDGGYSNAVFFTINNTVASPATTTNNGNNYNYPVTNFYDTNNTFTDTVQTGNPLNNDINGNSSNIAASAIFGSNSFLPSGLIQWVLFGIIILLLVILVRKIFGYEERYHSVPLKHD